MNHPALAMLLLSGVVLAATAVSAQAFDMFPSKAAAEKRAKELKCSGVFAMGKDWMPCANEQMLHKAL
ncbi:DUF3721 domain-containing protein [Cyanobium sp. AMD-g]|uniref:DUF3721 domain-containing protein n=1 Tax=Cyanobium sp. AMD-g TaxID=2823699 RepID=UPI0020CEA564|nr:DUF3721 domain-containing protein [Cyanobium sp. AMD-g]MCP9929704.1 DUF3721 domain-containing protein [Cyanobium sp. AMD-g]